MRTAVRSGAAESALQFLLGSVGQRESTALDVGCCNQGGGAEAYRRSGSLEFFLDLQAKSNHIGLRTLMLLLGHRRLAVIQATQFRLGIFRPSRA